jgi:hypothetical protein
VFNTAHAAATMTDAASKTTIAIACILIDGLAPGEVRLDGRMGNQVLEQGVGL